MISGTPSVRRHIPGNPFGDQCQRSGNCHADDGVCERPTNLHSLRNLDLCWPVQLWRRGRNGQSRKVLFRPIRPSSSIYLDPICGGPNRQRLRGGTRNGPSEDHSGRGRKHSGRTPANRKRRWNRKRGQFYWPLGIAIDGSGNVYVADTWNNTIRKITPAGIVTTLAGMAGNKASRTGRAIAARFFIPDGVAADACGNVYVADTFNNTIRARSRREGLSPRWRAKQESRKRRRNRKRRPIFTTLGCRCGRRWKRLCRRRQQLTIGRSRPPGVLRLWPVPPGNTAVLGRNRKRGSIQFPHRCCGGHKRQRLRRRTSVTAIDPERSHPVASCAPWRAHRITGDGAVRMESRSAAQFACPEGVAVNAGGDSSFRRR